MIQTYKTYIHPDVLVSEWPSKVEKYRMSDYKILRRRRFKIPSEFHSLQLKHDQNHWSSNHSIHDARKLNRIVSCCTRIKSLKIFLCIQLKFLIIFIKKIIGYVYCNLYDHRFINEFNNNESSLSIFVLYV